MPISTTITSVSSGVLSSVVGRPCSLLKLRSLAHVRLLAASAALSPDHTTLLKALGAAGLADKAKEAGPYTVFAPDNAAFDKLPAGTVASLVTPEMKPTLTKILTYHVVPGRLMAADLKNGQVLTTVQGETLTVMVSGSGVMLKDAKGGMAKVTIANAASSNGVTHVIDTVLMPAK